MGGIRSGIKSEKDSVRCISRQRKTDQGQEERLMPLWKGVISAPGACQIGRERMNLWPFHLKHCTGGRVRYFAKQLKCGLRMIDRKLQRREKAIWVCRKEWNEQSFSWTSRWQVWWKSWAERSSNRSVVGWFQIQQKAQQKRSKLVGKRVPRYSKRFTYKYAAKGISRYMKCASYNKI